MGDEEVYSGSNGLTGSFAVLSFPEVGRGFGPLQSLLRGIEDSPLFVRLSTSVLMLLDAVAGECSVTHRTWIETGTTR